MDEHSTARGQFYYLLTLKIITCLARAETWLVDNRVSKTSTRAMHV